MGAGKTKWVLPPQGTTKTIKNELNPVFEEDFVIDHTAAVHGNSSQELQGQDVMLFVTVHDWNRTSSDALLGGPALIRSCWASFMPCCLKTLVPECVT